MKRISLIILLFICAYVGSAEALGVRDFMREGGRAYDKKDYSVAQKAYERGLKDYPNSSELNYDAGAAAYKDGKFDRSSGYFVRSLVTEDRDIEYRALYNLGNSRHKEAEAAKKDDRKRAEGLYTEAMGYYKKALTLRPSDMDAKYNYELTEKRLRELREDMKKNPQEKNKDKSQDDRHNSGKDNDKDRERDSHQMKRPEQGKDRPAASSGGKMSKDEANSLVDRFERENRGTPKAMQPLGGFPHVSKDW